MKIVGIMTAGGDISVGTPMKKNTPKEIKYFESSQVYGKFLHEPLFAVELENSTERLLVPARTVEMIVIDTKKDDAKLDVKELG